LIFSSFLLYPVFLTLSILLTLCKFLICFPIIGDTSFDTHTELQVGVWNSLFLSLFFLSDRSRIPNRFHFILISCWMMQFWFVAMITQKIEYCQILKHSLISMYYDRIMRSSGETWRCMCFALCLLADYPPY
jgi:hypothetical protein